jgi:hypothetical protein
MASTSTLSRPLRHSTLEAGRSASACAGVVALNVNATQARMDPASGVMVVTGQGLRLIL